jgi:DnaJ-class molecular chaperone
MSDEERTIIEETQEICSLCGGRCNVQSYTTTAATVSCPQCEGRGYIVTKRVVHRTLQSGPKTSVYRQT